MRLFRSERSAAFLLLGAAILGVVAANSVLGPALQALRDHRLSVSWFGIDLSVGAWVTDGLLAVFFFLAAIELKHELRHGELDSARKALVPTIAAVGGVVVPAVIFTVLVPVGELSKGWPIPTATDIAFALGVLAVVGRALPARVRALLLALAVIDDLIAIAIIAIFFTDDLQPLPLLAAVAIITLFGWLSRRARSHARDGLLIVLAAVAWVLVYLSGVHATVAGVALGLVMAGPLAAQARRILEPWSNVVILPVFAFVAALVVLPAVGMASFSPVFLAIIVALPIGKLIGITGGAILAGKLTVASERLPLGDILAVAGLGGIGFTVSLLMNELAYHSQPKVAVEGTLAVLIASVIAAVIGVTLTAIRASHYRAATAG